MVRNLRSLLRLSLLFSVGTFCSPSSWAQAHNQFVYVNDNPASAPNTLEGFSVASNGALTALPGSAFLTGGTGGGVGFFASPQTSLRTMGNFLYVSNDGSADISMFKINPTTGIPTLSAFGPVSTGGARGSSIGLAVSPDGEFLFSTNSGPNSISAFAIGPAGGLAPVPHSPFATTSSPDGIIVTRDSRFVIDAEPDTSEIGVFAIAANGSLTPVNGSPFPAAGQAAGLDLDCSGQHLFVGDATAAGTSVEVYSIGSSGSLTPIPGSPFQFTSGAGNNSNDVLLNSTGRLLYVSNLDSTTVTTFRVNETTRALKTVSGDPFPDGNSGDMPSGISIDPASHFIFTVNFKFSGPSSDLGVLAATGDGKLLPVPGSPFPLRLGVAAQSVTAFPTKSCGP